MPRKPATPKPIVLALTSDKTGVTLKVGNSPTTAATLYPRHVAEMEKLLGMDATRELLRKQIIAERDQARADHAAADVTLQETLDDLKKAGLQRDAAEADRNVWEKAAKEDRIQIVTLADDLARTRQALRDVEKLRGESLHERDVTILGWRLATVAMAIVAVVLAAWRAGR